MTLLLIAVLAYLIGSIPTAYLLSNLIFNRDIRTSGTGNVGTINFLRVNKSKSFAIIVLFIDVLKGYAAIWLALLLIPTSQLMVPAIMVVLGHIYPVWLKGKGGRGLATLAGIFLFLEPLVVLIWFTIFGIIYFATKKYISGAMIALFLTNIIIAVIYGHNLFFISSSASLLVMMKYLPRLKQELTNA